MLWGQSAYLQSRYNAAMQARSNVEVQLQRQLDLIPNIAAVASEFSDRELEAVKELQELARSYKAAGESQTLIALNGAMGRFQETLSSKSGELFANLQVSLEGTQNRITVARTRFNEAATKYEDARTVGLSGLIASLQDRPQIDWFEAQPEARQAPTLFRGR